MHPKAVQVLHYHAQGMNQMHIAEQLGINQSTVSRILSDPANRMPAVTADSDMLAEAEAMHAELSEAIKSQGIVIGGKPNPLIRKLATLEGIAREQSLFDRTMARLFTMMVQGQIGRTAEVRDLRDLTGLGNDEPSAEIKW